VKLYQAGDALRRSKLAFLSKPRVKKGRSNVTAPRRTNILSDFLAGNLRKV
jgi:hypothetical protein